MKKLIAIGTVAALVAFSSSAQQRAQNQTAAPADPGAGFGPPQLTTFKVRDNFYMIRNDQSGNCSVLIAADGVVLIDNKFAMDHDSIMTKLREITDKPVLYVINTHMHADHSGGNATKQALGAKVIAH
jgi:cyclase